MEKEISWGCTPETGKLAAALSNLSAFPAHGECELKYTNNQHFGDEQICGRTKYLNPNCSWRRTLSCRFRNIENIE